MFCKLFKSTVMIKKESTDAQLVSAYMNGNEQAISELITRHKQKIYSFIYTLYLEVRTWVITQCTYNPEEDIGY